MQLELRGGITETRQIPHQSRASNRGTMATAASFVLLVVFSSTIAQDVKLIYKSSTKPVRLFTEEELRRFDGSEVSVFPHIIQFVGFCYRLQANLRFQSFPPTVCLRKDIPFIWQ